MTAQYVLEHCCRISRPFLAPAPLEFFLKHKTEAKIADEGVRQSRVLMRGAFASPATSNSLLDHLGSDPYTPTYFREISSPIPPLVRLDRQLLRRIAIAASDEVDISRPSGNSRYCLTGASHLREQKHSSLRARRIPAFAPCGVRPFEKRGHCPSYAANGT